MSNFISIFHVIAYGIFSISQLLLMCLYSFRQNNFHISQSLMRGAYEEGRMPTVNNHCEDKRQTIFILACCSFRNLCWILYAFIVYEEGWDWAIAVHCYFIIQRISLAQNQYRFSFFLSNHFNLKKIEWMKIIQKAVSFRFIFIQKNCSIRMKMRNN